MTLSNHALQLLLLLVATAGLIIMVYRAKGGVEVEKTSPVTARVTARVPPVPGSEDELTLLQRQRTRFRPGGPSFCSTVDTSVSNAWETWTVPSRPVIEWPSSPQSSGLGVGGNWVADRMKVEYYLYESFLTVLASALTRDGKCSSKNIVVDIGVNVGWFSTLLTVAGCDVVGFEPQEQPLTHACRVVARNDGLGRYTAYNAALANKRGSGHSKNAAGYGPGNTMVFDETVEEGKPQPNMLQTYRLQDKIFSDVVFLKVDVEGAEIVVLDTIVDFVQNTKFEIEHVLIEYVPSRWTHYLPELDTEAMKDKAIAQLSALIDAGYTVHDCRWDITEQQHAKKFAPDWVDGDLYDRRFSEAVVWQNADQVIMHKLEKHQLATFITQTIKCKNHQKTCVRECDFFLSKTFVSKHPVASSETIPYYRDMQL